MTTTTNWEEEVGILINEWCHRMVNLGQIKLPRESKYGFTVFLCPELADVIRSLLAKQRQELLDQVKSAVESCSLDLVACSDYAPPFRKDYTDKWKLLQKLSALRLEGGKK